MMGMLEDLHRSHEAGELNEEQEGRYARLRIALGEGLPIMRRLELELPPDSVLLK